jgi:histidine triad (HIT) family protein
MSCTFCRILEGELPSHSVYEDEYTYAFLDIHPVSKGHTLIIPRRHEALVQDLSSEEAEALFRTVHKLVKPIQEAMDAPASNIGVNNGRVAGQIIPHVHFHIIPQSTSEKGGFHRIRRSTRTLPEKEFEKIALKIREKVRESLSG